MGKTKVRITFLLDQKEFMNSVDKEFATESDSVTENILSLRVCRLARETAAGGAEIDTTQHEFGERMEVVEGIASAAMIFKLRELR